MQNQHHYTTNSKDTVTAVLSAGMDTDCGGFMGSKTMKSLLDDAKVQALADTALKNLFMIQFRLGLADPVQYCCPALLFMCTALCLYCSLSVLLFVCTALYLYCSMPALLGV